MLSPARLHRRRAVHGFMLMDVLVSILLFSVGVLALIALQSSMTRAQTESKVRADASYLASELVGQMWGDINALSSYTSTSCAGYDRCKEWQDRVASSLPQGSGTVAANSATGDVTITITWTTPSGNQHQYVTQTTIVKAGG